MPPSSVTLTSHAPSANSSVPGNTARTRRPRDSDSYLVNAGEGLTRSSWTGSSNSFGERDGACSISGRGIGMVDRDPSPNLFESETTAGK